MGSGWRGGTIDERYNIEVLVSSCFRCFSTFSFGVSSSAFRFAWCCVSLYGAFLRVGALVSARVVFSFGVGFFVVFPIIFRVGFHVFGCGVLFVMFFRIMFFPFFFVSCFSAEASRGAPKGRIKSA